MSFIPGRDHSAKTRPNPFVDLKQQIKFIKFNSLLNLLNYIITPINHRYISINYRNSPFMHILLFFQSSQAMTFMNNSELRKPSLLPFWPVCFVQPSENCLLSLYHGAHANTLLKWKHKDLNSIIPIILFHFAACKHCY